MGKELTISEVMAEIYQSVLATPKRQRRLLSKSFWAKFGFKVRTKERIEQVREALKRQGLVLNLDDAHFGTESRDDWITLSYVEPSLPSGIQNQSNSNTQILESMPPDSWFQLMENRQFESEREVEYYFILPLLESLGYEDDDFAIGYPIEMFEGVTKVKKEADFAIFNGLSREKKDALLVVEAKKANKLLTEDAVGQAKGYAVWLTTPYYVATNAEEIRLYLSRAGLQPDVALMKFPRSELHQNWMKLYQNINKAAVIERKKKLDKILSDNGM